MRLRTTNNSYAQTGRQAFRKSCHIKYTLKLIECCVTQRRRTFAHAGMKITINIVFKHIAIMLIKQAQHLISACRRQAERGRIMQHTVGQIQLRFVMRHYAREDFNVRSIFITRDADHPQTMFAQALKQPKPARIIDQNRIARLEKITRHQINCTGYALCTNHLLWSRQHANLMQLHHHLFTQANETLHMTVIINMRFARSCHASHRNADPLILQP